MIIIIIFFTFLPHLWKKRGIGEMVKGKMWYLRAPILWAFFRVVSMKCLVENFGLGQPRPYRVRSASSLFPARRLDPPGPLKKALVTRIQWVILYSIDFIVYSHFLQKFTINTSKKVGNWCSPIKSTNLTAKREHQSNSPSFPSSRPIWGIIVSHHLISLQLFNGWGSPSILQPLQYFSIPQNLSTAWIDARTNDPNHFPIISIAKTPFWHINPNIHTSIIDPNYSP